MPDTSIPRVELGASTTNRKWFFDIWNGAAYIGVFGLSEFKDNKETTNQDASDFATPWKGTAKTALGWSIEGKLLRKPIASSNLAYDPGQELLRAASDLVGLAARVKVRWYEMEPGGPRVEAYEGFGTVDWSPDGGGMDAVSTVTFKVNGDGSRTAVVHPQPAVPYITSILPTGRSAGGLLTVTGTNLSSVTSGTIGGTNITAFNVLSDTQIAFVIPAGVTAGAKNVILTNPVGASAAFAYAVA